MEPHRIGNQGTPHGALHYQYCMLFHLLLHYGTHEDSPFHGWHIGGSTYDSNRLRYHQCLVEDIHPLSSHWRRDRRHSSLLTHLLVQPHLVALLGFDIGGNGGHGAHDTAAALAFPSGGGILCGTDLRILHHPTFLNYVNLTTLYYIYKNPNNHI